ncbi:hypothetical protein ACFOZ0_01435 [Streptomyces yaanensis]|uniref:Integral membrane protein n=1 Tax=Streptomyces yaanensis TaxID=1142239 RepID=A0ABV7S958_9ACTN|nr:hypothetical protein [Streptomyces sp. CGMCC 4.7035]WNB99570.1 hypothetical protein Q2K21_16660 [Streptomyces sp. CGMCC 4.7035]
MSSTKRLWRWRSNPLRRQEDVIETWVVLAVWFLMAIGGAITGLVTVRSVEHEYAEQRAHRHPVQAVLLADAPPRIAGGWSTDGRVQGTVRWTAADGTSRSGHTLVGPGLEAGARVTVWEDGQGRLAPSAPTGSAEGHLEAALFGGAAALAVAVPVFGAGAIARARLEQRRMAHWDQEWDLIGRQWGPKTS